MLVHRDRKLPALLLAASVGFGSTGALAQTRDAPLRITLLTASDHIARGDELYAKGQSRDAHSAYMAALASEPGHVVALTKASRIESELGEDAKGDEQRKLTAAAVQHAREAVKMGPEDAQTHLALAVALGRQALKEGPKTRLALSREIKSEVDRSIALDPNLGRAYHVRALWNRKIASLSAIERMAANTVLGGVPKGASMENAVRDLERAIALEPDYVNHRLELGRTLMKIKRHVEARRELEKAVSLAPISNPRDAKYQAEARELLGKLKG